MAKHNNGNPCATGHSPRSIGDWIVCTRCGANLGKAR